MLEQTAMTQLKILWKKSPEPVSYPDALSEMQRLTAEIRSGEGSECVWLLQHPALFTAGTSARIEDLFNPNQYPTYDAGRGGQWTYHGPGQRIAYVMLDLTRPHGDLRPRDLRQYVNFLEEWIIQALALLGVRGERRCDRIGVWICDPETGVEEKIAAIGVRVSRWTSWHGIAINVDPDLNDFDGIVPCGIRGYGVTSLRKLGVNASMEDVDRALEKTWGLVFGGELSEGK